MSRVANIFEHMFDVEVFETPPPSLDELELSPDEWSLIDLAPDTGWQSIPAGLDEMTPGPYLAVILSHIDPSACSGLDRVRVLKARQRMISHYQSGMYSDIVSIAEATAIDATADNANVTDVAVTDHDQEMVAEATALEVRAALRLTRRSADMEVDLAHDLCHRLPAVGKALAAGDIDLRRARLLVEGTSHLPEPDARRTVDELVGEAPRMTSGQLRARIRQVCLGVDPAGAKSRYQLAHEDRRIVADTTNEGTTDLHLLGLAPDQAAEAYNRIDALARSLRVPGETRTMDQLRADVTADLLAGKITHPKTGRGTVVVHVDLTTLAGLDDHPGELAGYGPVIADIARQIADQQSDAEWRWSTSDPQTRQVIANGITRKRRASTRQRRHVEARNPTCVFPGCRAPAVNTDLDHIKPWAETGHTTIDELAPLCRHDHTQRHRHSWEYRPTGDGDYEWTSLLGNKYRTSGLPPPKRLDE